MNYWSDDGLLTVEGCREFMRGLLYGMQRSRSMFAEGYERQVIAPAQTPEDAERAASYLDPWLFSQEARDWIVWIQENEDSVGPIEVMNIAVALRRKARRRGYPPGPGDSLGMKMISPWLTISILREPLLAVSNPPPADGQEAPMR